MLSIGELAPSRIIPVVVVDDVSVAAGVRDALAAGGLACAEVTFRTDAALAAIAVMAEDPDFVVGAGTVTTPRQVEDAVAAGARFVVSPGLSAAVVAACDRLEVLCVPGAVTATEIMTALDLGIETVKFFPAEVCGGLTAIAALSAPFPNVRFVPTGGIRPSNIDEYLRSPVVAAVGGTWLTPAGAQRARDFAMIADLSRAAVDLAGADA